MTTGRINQVTTIRQAPQARPTARRAVGNIPKKTWTTPRSRRRVRRPKPRSVGRTAPKSPKRRSRRGTGPKEGRFPTRGRSFEKVRGTGHGPSPTPHPRTFDSNRIEFGKLPSAHLRTNPRRSNGRQTPLHPHLGGLWPVARARTGSNPTKTWTLGPSKSLGAAQK